MSWNNFDRKFMSASCSVRSPESEKNGKYGPTFSSYNNELKKDITIVKRELSSS